MIMMGKSIRQIWVKVLVELCGLVVRASDYESSFFETASMLSLSKTNLLPIVLTNALEVVAQFLHG